MDRFIQLINRSNEINNQEFSINIFENLLDIVNNTNQDTENTENNSATKKNFIDTLEKINNQNPDLTCHICLDKININEECIKLPCKDHPHFFHEGNENCPGILEWLNKSNTCPVCRTEFPKEEPQNNIDQSVGRIIIQRVNIQEQDQEQEQEQEQEEEEVIIDNPEGRLNQFIDIILRREEERQIEYAIQQSLIESDNNE